MTRDLVIRRARKSHRCVNAAVADRGNPSVASCTRTIKPGEQYAEGDCDPYYAGGFGYEHICLPCVEGGQA